MKNTVIKDYERRVERGMKWLDKNKPGWEKKINLSRLDLGDANICITGQVYGDFWGKFIDVDKMSRTQAYDHGFYLGDPTEQGGPEEEYRQPETDKYDLLTAIWYYKVSMRLAQCEKRAVIKRTVKKIPTKKRA